MKGLVAFGSLLLAGIACMATGIYLTFGTGPALLLLGFSCLVAALVILRGLSVA